MPCWQPRLPICTRWTRFFGAVEDLGRRHVAYGVTPSITSRSALRYFGRLRKGSVEDFTPPVKAAWTEVYTTVAGVMTKAAAGVAQPEPKKGFMARLFG